MRYFSLLEILVKLSQELMAVVERMNEDPKINGILVQLPLPKHLDEAKVLMAIDPGKDVDGFHPMNVGKSLLLNALADIGR